MPLTENTEIDLFLNIAQNEIKKLEKNIKQQYN
jgi:hypothetical protein